MTPPPSRASWCAPILQGYVDGILAVLRVDPRAATAAFQARVVDDDDREAIFAGGRGVVGYWLLEDLRTVAVVNVTWLGRSCAPATLRRGRRIVAAA